MCFSANMSLGMGVAGFIASAITLADTKEAFWIRFARAFAIFHFSLMELIQYFAYPVVDQCGYGSNLLLSELSTYHIKFQALAIMPALATYSSDPTALKKAALGGLGLSTAFLLFGLLPSDMQIYQANPNFIGDLVLCLQKGVYHIAYSINSAYGSIVTHGSLFALAFSGFLWKNNTRIATYHFLMSILTLFVPQWFFGVTTGEGAAIYCFYSIVITGSFMPYFKKYFRAKNSPAELKLC